LGLSEDGPLREAVTVATDGKSYLVEDAKKEVAQAERQRGGARRSAQLPPGRIWTSSMVILDLARRGVRVPALARWLSHTSLWPLRRP
jgi:hypothetical protein